MITAGIDAGSRAIKIVVYDSDEEKIITSGLIDQGVKQEALAEDLLQDILSKNGHCRDDIERIVVTGYGRNIIGFSDKTITEITCHARGVRYHMPEAQYIIEIGGQDSKYIRLDAKGILQDFSMNDRCAAGTGRFLEVVAERLDVPLDDLGAMASKSSNPASISSMCVVFAETEIIGLLASGTAPEDIVAGVQIAIARRACSMAGRNITGPIVFTGGVALVPGMHKAIQEVLEKEVLIAPQPQMTGALGAAILAARN